MIRSFESQGRSFAVSGRAINPVPGDVLTWEGETDWNNAQSRSLVHNAQPTGTDWAGVDTLELGYLTSDQGGTALERYYTIDEDSGTDINDISGNNGDGTLQDGTLDVSGILGFTAFSGDGSNDWIDLPGRGNPADYGIQVWVKFDSVPSGDAVIYHQRDNANNTNNPQLYYNDGQELRLLDQRHGYDAVYTWTPNTDQWYHIFGVGDSGTGNGRLYVDATQEASGSRTTQTFSSITDGSIGALASDGSQNFPGDIDETRVYSRAPADSLITTLALQDDPTGFLITAAKSSSAGLPLELTTTTTIPANTSIDVVVHQDTNQDGTSDNSETVPLSGGTDETNSLTAANFTEDTDGADYWLDWQASVTNPTDVAPTGSKLAVTVG